MLFEREQLISDLKKILQGSESDSELMGCAEDLAKLEFDEKQAKRVGKKFVKYSIVVQNLIRELFKLKGVPGLSTQQMDGEKVLLFKGTDLAEFVRSETN